MLSLNFLSTNLNKVLSGMLLLLVGGGLVSYAIYGPYYSPDTVNYFNFSRHLSEESRWISIYSPAYPFLLNSLTMAGISWFKAAQVLILLQYGLSSYFLYRWAKITTTHYHISHNNQISFLALLLLVVHSWWSFRILTWAHADSVFYCLLVIWTYFLSLHYLQKSFMALLVLSLVSASMIWVKLNALALIPFYALLIALDKDRNRWLAPFGVTTASYFCYRYITHYQFLNVGALDNESPTGLLSAESLHLLANNLAELLKTTVGFFLSDVITAFIPHTFAILGGISLLLGLLFIVFRETKKGLSLSSLFLVFGLVYLLCQLAFQQLISSEEINYRTLFPYFLSCSGYGLIKLFDRGQIPVATIFLAALLIFGHSLAGHVWLWKRTEVNSIFEVERLAETEMVDKVRLLHQEDSTDYSFISNRPELLGLLLDAPFVVHYDPEFDFIDGKRRPVPDLERQQRRADLMEKLLKAEAVVVIFGEDEDLIQFAEESGLMVAEFPEGVVLVKVGKLNGLRQNALPLHSFMKLPNDSTRPR
jgi:hypothetical protein